MRKERGPVDPLDLSESRRGSVDSIRSPSSSHPRVSALSDVPEEDGAFAIGDDDEDDDDDEHQATPPESTATEPSQASSVSSGMEGGIDDAVPTQLRGMSEKARGKMPGKSTIPYPHVQGTTLT